MRRCRQLIAGKGLVWNSGLLTRLGRLQAQAFPLQHQLGVIDQLHAMLAGELLCAGGGEVDMRAAFEHQAGRLDGVLEALHASHGAGPQGGAIHHESIQLDPAITGKKAAPAGIEGFVIFEQGDGGFHRIQRGRSLPQQEIAYFGGAGDAPGVRLQLVSVEYPRRRRGPAA